MQEVDEEKKLVEALEQYIITAADRNRMNSFETYSLPIL